MNKRVLGVLLLLAFVGFGAGSLNLTYITLVRGEYYKHKAENQQLKDTVITPDRGAIYDTNMQILAKNETVWTLYISPSFIKTNTQREELADGFSRMLSMDRDKIISLSRQNSGYVIVKRGIEKPLADEIRVFIQSSKDGLTAVAGLTESSQRAYPSGSLASDVLGFMGTDQGLAGLESYYNTLLTGTPGRVVTAKNGKGGNMPDPYESLETPAKPGDSLVLTIDAQIQQYAEKYLSQAVVNNHVKNRACAIIMDIHTGGILGMATEPDFDPNHPYTVADPGVAAELAKLSGDEKAKATTAALNEQWRNKAVSDLYEPGSVFKVVTGSAALEEGVVSASSYGYYDTGAIKVGDKTYHCADRAGHGQENLADVFANSCNPAFISIGQTLGVNRFFKYFSGYGLTQKTGIDLPGEASPIYHPLKSMSKVDLASESFGQAFEITPIQMITAFAATVNGGYLVQPHLVRQILGPDGNVIQDNGATQKRQVVSAATSELMNSLLEGVVKNGTGRNAYLPGYRVEGKTGTSQKLNAKNNEYIASFCGVAPANNPQVAVLVMLDTPQVANFYGGTIAAPVVRQILSDTLPALGVQPQYTPEEQAAMAVPAPNTVGKSLEEAKNALTSADLKYKVVGTGDTVQRQVPAAGQSLMKKGTVVLYTQADSKMSMTTMPSFGGMTVSQVNQAASNANINVVFVGDTLTGSGARVSSQSVEAGSKVESGTLVTVEFQYIDTSDNLGQ